ncbi:hypothetical protein ACSBR1_027422 [Camellia fascicularis]
MDDEQDFLAKYCSHVEKGFLSAPWANRIRHVGQSFERGATEFRMVIRKVCDKPLTRPTNVVYDLKKDYDGVVVQTPKNSRAGSGLVSNVIFERAQSWPGVVSPKMEDQLVKAYNKGRSWLLSQINNEVFKVHSFLLVMVDVGRCTCSCFQWQIKGFPCAHAVVNIHNSGLDLYELVDPYYHMS